MILIKKVNSIHIVYTDAAIDDLDIIFDYISMDNRLAAEALLNKMEDGINMLREYPKLGAIFPSNEYSYVEERYRFLSISSYLVFYRIVEETIIITRILHANQDWLNLLFHRTN